MKNNSTENIIGIKVSRRNTTNHDLEFTRELIPDSTLAEMIRSKVRPLLDIEEIKKLNKQFTLISGFATIHDYEL